MISEQDTYTPLYEIPLAGHPTIATIHALIISGQIPTTSKNFTIQLELQVGEISIDVTVSDSGQYLITMYQKQPEFLIAYRHECFIGCLAGGGNERLVVLICPEDALTVEWRTLLIKEVSCP